MDFFEFFSGFDGLAGYIIVLVTLVACGLGLPVPEDVILIAGGYLAAESHHPLWPMMLTGLVGIMLGDSVIYSLGRRFGMKIAERPFLRRFVTPVRLQKVNEMFERHGEKILIAARFMPGVRSVAFFSAGAMRVKFWKFFLLDGVAALVSAPLWVFLGHEYGKEVVEWAKGAQLTILGVVVIAIAAFFIRRALRKKATTVVLSTSTAPTDGSPPPQPHVDGQ